MEKTHGKIEKIRQLLFILIPIFITQLGMITLTFFDTTMSGHYSPIDLAGVAIGASIWVPIFTGLSGILLAVTPIVAQLVGARKNDKVAFSIIQAIYFAGLLALIVLALGALFLNPILNNMNLERDVHLVAKGYLIALSYGLIPLFVYGVFRSFIDALGKTRISMIITLLSLPINILLNYLLIYGKLGFPELGGVGAGYATAVTYWIITIIAAIIIHKQKPFVSYQIFHKFFSIH